MREEDFEDIEEMTQMDIRKKLVDHGFLKARKEDNIDMKLVEEDIKADNSIYLFHRKGCFRRNVHFV